jgi:hypothetical protein
MATYETALDQRITVGDQTFAYRLFGNAGQGVTLALLHGFRYLLTFPTRHNTEMYDCGANQHGTNGAIVGEQWIIGIPNL